MRMRGQPLPLKISEIRMNRYYIAGIVPEQDGGYSVYFPDVPNAAVGGETVEEAIFLASEGLIVALRGMIEQGTAIPDPSPMSAVKRAVEAERLGDDLPYPADTIYQYVAAPSLETVPVRVNVTIPKGALDEIDARAKSLGYTRSGYLTRAALEYRA